jgi:alkyl sulfatase BDS1-like metallo-beta-lactamase superfamily hydrolase
VAQHAATLKALPFSDTRDFDEASRGFLRHGRKCADCFGAGQGGLEPRALRFSLERTKSP